MPRTVTSRAVRSYRTLSPLPVLSENSHRRFALCCTCRRLAPPRRYLALCPMKPGLSSPCLRKRRLPSQLRAGVYTNPHRLSRPDCLVLHKPRGDYTKPYLMSRSDCLGRNKPSDYRTGAIIFNAIFSMRISSGNCVSESPSACTGSGLCSL